MAQDGVAQGGILATVSQPNSAIAPDSVSIATQGGVAILAILSVAYLVRCLAYLVEVLRKSGD